MIYVSISPTEVGPIVQEVFQRATTIWRTAQFSATVHNDPSHRGVIWEVAQGGGSIDERGVFTPPVEPQERAGRGKSTIRAIAIVDPTQSATATVTY